MYPIIHIAVLLPLHLPFKTTCNLLMEFGDSYSDTEEISDCNVNHKAKNAARGARYRNEIEHLFGRRLKCK